MEKSFLKRANAFLSHENRMPTHGKKLVCKVVFKAVDLKKKSWALPFGA